MKITFLGTSHGIPSETRFCSAALLETGGRAYLIDAGAPVADLLIRRGVPFTALCAIFTTHIHADHTLGLLPLVSLCNWKYKETSFDIFLTEDEGVEAFRRVVDVTDGGFSADRLRFRKTVPGVFYADDRITVTAIPTRHMEHQNGRPSYAYLIDAEGKRVVFTGDLHWGDAADFPRQAMEYPSETIVCESAHFAPATVLPYLLRCPTKRILFNHVAFNYDESMAAIREAAKTEPRITAVEDGDVIEL